MLVSEIKGIAAECDFRYRASARDPKANHRIEFMELKRR